MIEITIIESEKCWEVRVTDGDSIYPITKKPTADLAALFLTGWMVSDERR
jgi:hypothetical protein